MDNKELATRVTDIERVLGEFNSPVLGNHFRATLPTGKAVRLLISLQGQDKIYYPALNSIAHSEVGLSQYELKTSYLPLFQNWGFIDVHDDYVVDRDISREKILERAGKWWKTLEPHPVEALSVDLFNRTAKAPLSQDYTQTVLDQFSKDDCVSCLSHMSGAGLVDVFPYKDINWYYSPEVFGENFEKVIGYLSSQSKDRQKNIREIIDVVSGDQGIPYDFLQGKVNPTLPDQMSGVGLLYGFPLTIGNSQNIFYFTPDLRSRFEREGRGDKFEIIKPGVAHFQYANKLALARTGRLKFNPAVFLNRLIVDGVAGDATAIGRDYELLVKKGLLKIEPTSATKYKFLLPDSREKIADLEAVRDAFKAKQIIPPIDFSEMGIRGKIQTQDSLVHRSKHALKNKELAQQFAQEVFKI